MSAIVRNSLHSAPTPGNPSPLCHGRWPIMKKKPLALPILHGKPTIVIFYLGAGCLHCVEQLHKFGPKAAEFAQQRD